MKPVPVFCPDCQKTHLVLSEVEGGFYEICCKPCHEKRVEANHKHDNAEVGRKSCSEEYELLNLIGDRPASSYTGMGYTAGGGRRIFRNEKSIQ